MLNRQQSYLQKLLEGSYLDFREPNWPALLSRESNFFVLEDGAPAKLCSTDGHLEKNYAFTLTDPFNYSKWENFKRQPLTGTNLLSQIWWVFGNMTSAS